MLTAIICIIGFFVIVSAIWNFRNSYILSKNITDKNIEDPKYWELRYKYEFMVATFSIVVAAIGFLGYNTYENAISRLRIELEIKNNATNKQLKEAEEKASALQASVEKSSESARYMNNVMFDLQDDLKKSESKSDEMDKKQTRLDYYFQFKIEKDLSDIRRIQGNLEGKLNNEVKDYLERSQESQIDSAISDLTSMDQLRMSRGAMYFQFTQYLPMTDKQIKRLIQITKKPEFDKKYIQTFMSILAYKQSKSIDDFFEEISLRKDIDENLLSTALVYFSLHGINKYYDVLRKVFIESQYRERTFITAIGFLVVDRKNTEKLLNDQAVINALYNNSDKGEQWQNFKSNVSVNVSEEVKGIFGNTYLGGKK